MDRRLRRWPVKIVTLCFFRLKKRVCFKLGFLSFRRQKPSNLTTEPEPLSSNKLVIWWIEPCLGGFNFEGFVAIYPLTGLEILGSLWPTGERMNCSMSWAHKPTKFLVQTVLYVNLVCVFPARCWYGYPALMEATKTRLRSMLPVWSWFHQYLQHLTPCWL